MCYGCLHQSLVAAIGRQMNPYARHTPARRGGRRKKSAFASLAAGGQYVPPSKWTQETLEEAWAASQDDHTRRQLTDDGQPPEQIEAILEVQRQVREVAITHPLEGLWGLGENQWVVEGECPVSTSFQSVRGGPNSAGHTHSVGITWPRWPRSWDRVSGPAAQRSRPLFGGGGMRQ